MRYWGIRLERFTVLLLCQGDKVYYRVFVHDKIVKCSQLMCYRPPAQVVKIHLCIAASHSSA